ncbi:MAG: glycosyltransferase family 9 protein [Xanthomonadales bacterium]|nr:glycosyltransferase family 9 protein [Xanthomonadales bacterium]MBK7144805.1 glycosyltransferase family 9 protein [Xanthomonadales bacterium]MCC6562398.1 glycosyltransferase family 9 protein [Xanthomonadales bacterium]
MSAAASICIFRLSALGDVTHLLPLVHRIRRHQPDTSITWIIGQFESKLVGDLPGIEFIAIDKKQGLLAVWRELRARLHGRHFDALLLCQLAARANLLSTAVHARRRIGYDTTKSKEGHGWFINERITAATGRHVLDTLYRFGDALGLPDAPKCWDIPVPEEARAFAEQQLPGSQPTLIISPCSSHALRNWNVAGYARVAEHAIRRHGMRVLLCGGPSALEHETGAAIERACAEPLQNLIGKDTLKRACALFGRAAALLTPDAGPMHIANAMGTPVLGLHAATDSTRSGAYSDLRWTVDRYDAAARKFLGKPAADLPWGKRVEFPGVMNLIESEVVIERLDALITYAGK